MSEPFDEIRKAVDFAIGAYGYYNDVDGSYQFTDEQVTRFAKFMQIKFGELRRAEQSNCVLLEVKDTPFDKGGTIGPITKNPNGFA